MSSQNPSKPINFSSKIDLNLNLSKTPENLFLQNFSGRVKKYIKPVSYGILAFSLDYDEDYNPQIQEILNFRQQKSNLHNEVLYSRLKLLLIQRRHTMGYNDFVRGRYFFNESNDILQQYIKEMTPQERNNIEKMSFDELWDELWYNHNSKHYKQEKTKSQDKYNQIDIKGLLEKTDSLYNYTEFGIPKGRKNYKETEIECAEREFCEETGYDKSDYILLDFQPLVENFYGTNNINYSHIYYFALMKNPIKKPFVNPFNSKQMEEVKNLDFFHYQDAIYVLRDYDTEKKEIISQAFSKIQEFVNQTKL